MSVNGRLDGELQMTVAGIEKAIPALGIDKMLDEGVPQAALDQVVPGVKSQDVNNLLGALDRAIPGLGKIVKQNANAGVATAADTHAIAARSLNLFIDLLHMIDPSRICAGLVETRLTIGCRYSRPRRHAASRFGDQNFTGGCPPRDPSQNSGGVCATLSGPR